MNELNCLESFSIVVAVDVVKTADIVDTGIYNVLNKDNNLLTPGTDFQLKTGAEVINIIKCTESVSITINSSFEKGGTKFVFKLSNDSKLDNENLIIYPQLIARMKKDTYSLLIRYMNGKTGLVYAPEGCGEYKCDVKDDTTTTEIKIENLCGLQIIDY